MEARDAVECENASGIHGSVSARASLPRFAHFEAALSAGTVAAVACLARAAVLSRGHRLMFEPQLTRNPLRFEKQVSTAGRRYRLSQDLSGNQVRHLTLVKLALGRGNPSDLDSPVGAWLISAEILRELLSDNFTLDSSIFPSLLSSLRNAR